MDIGLKEDPSQNLVDSQNIFSFYFTFYDFFSIFCFRKIFPSFFVRFYFLERYLEVFVVVFIQYNISKVNISFVKLDSLEILREFKFSEQEKRKIQEIFQDFFQKKKIKNSGEFKKIFSINFQKSNRLDFQESFRICSRF